MIITVDGPAASGKGTLARRLAAALDCHHLDTGGLYRAVALAALQRGIDPGDDDGLTRLAEGLGAASFSALLADPALRAEETGNVASKAAAVSAVRAALLEQQRRIAHDPPGGKQGCVLDGRDTGTVVCPDAPVKLFITASPEERARRRALELPDGSNPDKQAAVLRDIRARDQRDTERSVAPLRPAEDAWILDTSALDADSVFDRALEHIRRTLAMMP